MNTETQDLRRAGRIKILDSMFADAKRQEKLAYLVSRWADEKEYEDIEEYRPHLAALMPEGAEVTRMTRRPFGCFVKFGDWTYQVKCPLSGRITVF